MSVQQRATPREDVERSRFSKVADELQTLDHVKRVSIRIDHRGACKNVRAVLDEDSRGTFGFSSVLREHRFVIADAIDLSNHLLIVLAEPVEEWR